MVARNARFLTLPLLLLFIANGALRADEKKPRKFYDPIEKNVEGWTIAVDPQLRVLRASAARLAGQHPTQLDIREKTGCSIVAVERGADWLVIGRPITRAEDPAAALAAINASLAN